ncbi:hypothetical protein D3C75_1124550 [compost metagenome]
MDVGFGEKLSRCEIRRGMRRQYKISLRVLCTESMLVVRELSKSRIQLGRKRSAGFDLKDCSGFACTTVDKCQIDVSVLQNLDRDGGPGKLLQLPVERIA